MDFYNKKDLRERRKGLRNNSTPEEYLLWQYLRNKGLGYKFRRQQSIRPYIVDFCCPKKRLNEVLYDKTRTDFLEHASYRILRFWNGDIRKDVRKAILKTTKACDS